MVSLQFVQYPQYLDLRSYMSQGAAEPLVYTLYAVLVHSGGSSQAGHYFCYTKVKSHFLCHGEECVLGKANFSGSQAFGGEGLLTGWMGFALVDSCFCSLLPVFFWRNHAVHLQISLPLFTGQRWTVVPDGRYVGGSLRHKHSSRAASLFTFLCQVIATTKMCRECISLSQFGYFPSDPPESFCPSRQLLPASFSAVQRELPPVSLSLPLLGFRLLPRCKLLLVCSL